MIRNYFDMQWAVYRLVGDTLPPPSVWIRTEAVTFSWLWTPDIMDWVDDSNTTAHIEVDARGPHFVFIANGTRTSCTRMRWLARFSDMPVPCSPSVYATLTPNILSLLVHHDT